MSTFHPPATPESARLFRFSLLLFVLASVYLAWPWLSGEVTIPWDSKAHFQPQLSFLAHALHDGQSPFWTPNVFAGMPQIADPQSLIFSPPFLLLAALVREPTFQQADAVSFLMLTLGGIGWMLYFRDRRWSAAGLDVTDHRIQGRPTPQNIHYLATKRDRAGHYLDVDIPPSGDA